MPEKEKVKLLLSNIKVRPSAAKATVLPTKPRRLTKQRCMT